MSEKIKPGYKTGAMTVLEQTGRMVGKYPVWRCRCECGREIDLDEGIIKMGTVKDCGCGRHKNPAISVLTGQRFGRLTVIGIDPQHGTKSSAAWLCKCDCGNYVTVAEIKLKNGLHSQLRLSIQAIYKGSCWKQIRPLNCTGI